MSLVDHIISGAMLLIVLVAVGTIITSQSVQTTQERIDFRQTSFMLDKHEGSLNTIMSINEPATRQSYARLLARSIYENRDTITLPSGEDVNISDLVDDALQMVYGPGNYYAQISPFINDVHIRLVFDGTGSLEEERDVVRNRLEDIITRTKEELGVAGGGNVPEVTFKTYIVTDDPSLCEPFEEITIAGFEGCEAVSKTDAYGPIEEPHIEGDLNEAYGTPGRETYYRGDWAAGVAKSLDNLREHIGDDARSIIIMFPVADEMTTGSIPDECYGTDIANPAGADFPGWEDRVLAQNAYYCAFCHRGCPEERSDQQITRLTDFIEEHEAIRNALFINPVYSDDWVDYDSGFNDPAPPVRWSGYIDRYIDDPDAYSPQPGQTYCDFEECEGCETNPDNSGQIRFRSICAERTVEQLNELSESYRGGFINLERVDDLPDEIIRSVEDAADALVTSYGERRDEDSRYVVTYSILLPNNERVPFTVWIYEDRVFDIHIPEIEITAQPQAVPPGQPIELRSRIETRGGVASVVLTPDIEGEEPIPLSLQMRSGDTYVYEAEYDTSGLGDGWYDVHYEVYDTAFNRFDGTAQDVFEIDQSLVPFPTVESVVFLPSRQLEGRDIDIIVRIEDEPVDGMDRSDVESVRITITAPDGSEREFTLDEHTNFWGTTFDSGSGIGTHDVTVHIEDEFGRTQAFSPYPYEVVERLECESTSDCSDPDTPDYCTGDTHGDYYCTPNPAGEDEYAADLDSCESGLAFDTDDDTCYQLPHGAVRIAFIALDFREADRALFENFARRTMSDYMSDQTPMRECANDDLRDAAFEFDIVFDSSCTNRCTRDRFETCRAGCSTNTCLWNCAEQSAIDDCLTDTEECQKSLSPRPDLAIGVSSFRWDTVHPYYIGGVAPLGSMYNVNWIGDTTEGYSYRTVLHEVGHSFSLYHVNCWHGDNVPANMCMGVNMNDCSSINPSAQPNLDVMSYCDTGYRYGEYAYAHLRNTPFFRAGLEVCT